MTIRVYRANPQDWRETLKAFQTEREDFTRRESIMTPYERVTISEYLGEERRRIGPVVIAGAKAEWDSAIEATRRALARVEEAKAAEARRWDAGKLGAELNLYKTLTDLALQSSPAGGVTVEQRLRAIYQDAKSSGDNYKLRAAAEVFASLGGKLGGDLEKRMTANRLVIDAQNDLAETRKYSELDAAHNQAAEAVEGLNQARRVMVETGEVLGDMLEINKNLQRVKVTPEGLEITDLDPNDTKPHETAAELHARIFGQF